MLAAIPGQIAPDDPRAKVYPPGLGPSLHHLFGTTAYGEDVFSQLVFGTRQSILIAFAVGGLATVIAVVVGVSAGYLGGTTDGILSLITDVILVIPIFPLIIVIAAYERNSGLFTLVIVLGVLGWSYGARQLRSQTLSLRTRDFLEAARVRGERKSYVIVHEILPTMTSLILASFLGAALYAVLFAAGLQFIGLGDPNSQSWGTMLYWAENNEALGAGMPYWAIMPGVCIALLGAAFALLNYAFDEVSSPALRLRKLERQGVDAEGAEVVPARPQDPKNILEVRNLSVAYASEHGPVVAVDDVSFELAKGEFLGVVGESACGKSTLVYAIARLLGAPLAGEITNGQVLFKGQDMVTLSDKQLRHIRWRDYSVVMQSAMNALNPVLTIGRPDARRVRGALDDVEAADRGPLEGGSAPGLDRPGAPPELPAPALGRDAAARDDRDGPAVHAGADHHGRADVGARRRRPALADGADQGAAGAARLRRHLRHARHVARAPLLRPAARDVRGAGGRAGADAAAVRASRCTRTRRACWRRTRRSTARRSTCSGSRARRRTCCGPPAGCRFAPRCPHAFARCHGRAAAAARGRRRARPLLPARAGGRGCRARRRSWRERAAAPGRGPDAPLLASASCSRASACTRWTTSSFEIGRGEIVALVGESGSGKSTIARLLARVYKPTAGEIYFEGRPVSSLRTRRQRLAYSSDVAMVFQDPYSSINPAYRVTHPIERGLVLHRREVARRRREAEVERSLAEVGLLPAARVATKFPHELSGGQRQRVGFASALAVKPKLIVADEPVSMLDVSIRIGVLNLMTELREREGVSFLYITHDVASARYVADRVLVLYAGHLVEEGPAEEVIQRPKHPYTQLLLSAVPDPRAELGISDAADVGEPPKVIDPQPGCRFRARCPFAIADCETVTPPLRPIGPGAPRGLSRGRGRRRGRRARTRLTAGLHSTIRG